MQNGLKVAVSFLCPSQHRSWVRPAPCHPIARNSSLRLTRPPSDACPHSLGGTAKRSSQWPGPLSCRKPLSGSSRLGSGFLLACGPVHLSTSVWAVAFAAAVPRADPSLSSASAQPVGPHRSSIRPGCRLRSQEFFPSQQAGVLAQHGLPCRGEGACFCITCL